VKKVLATMMAAGMFAAGAGGLWWGVDPLVPHAAWLLGVGCAMLGYAALQRTYYRSGTPWPSGSNQPQPLRLGWVDYLKAFVGWADSFKRTYVVEPGLYFTGESYDRDAPLLVTSNYLLTVFLVVRRVRAFNARLLVLDTDGINVWCSAGKGRFSRDAIVEQLDRYDREILTADERVTMILPKLSFSGVDLTALRESGIRPVIGPVYAKDLPGYLSNAPLKDRDEDRIVFGLQSRLFTWLPGLLQTLGYSLALVLLLLIASLFFGSRVPVGPVFLITALCATAYPVLFPWIPGSRFAVKGLWLGAAVAAGLVALTWTGRMTLAGLATSALFAAGTSVFFALGYTGNSAVSNYSRVRLEIARFLPVYVLLYAGSLVSFIVGEALQ